MSLLSETDFDEKNTNSKCAFRHNLYMFGIYNTHIYIHGCHNIQKKTAIVYLFSTIPMVLYISNSATPNVVQANEYDK
jgi:hypothetical protein